jgi:lipoprotein NlpI
MIRLCPAELIVTTVALMTPLSALADESTAMLLQTAQQLGEQGESERAVTVLDQVIERDANLAQAYYLRGRERFRLGRLEPSVADFDRYVQLQPERAARQWERGIALYYVGRFRDGAKQFEQYQTFQNNDVENSVWRYLCLARADSVDVARATLLPIENDQRIPMMQILELYRGKIQPDDVLAAVKQGNPSPEQLASRQFYAHLYLGLYYEANGKLDLARKYIELAADPRLQRHAGLNAYMWDVARIHARLLKQRESSARPPAKQE